jgi:hypothetical protein
MRVCEIYYRGAKMKHYFVSYMRMGIRYHKYYPAVSEGQAKIELLDAYPDAEDIEVWE